MQSAVARIPKTRNGCADAWYLTSFSIGSGRRSVAWKYICGRIKPKRMDAYNGSLIKYKYPATPNCVAVTLTAQIHLAVSTPNATGSDCKPNSLSPSMDLKSLTMAIPRPAMEYKMGLIPAANSVRRVLAFFSLLQNEVYGLIQLSKHSLTAPPR